MRKLLNMVLLMAIKDHASDLHFEPFEDEFRIRIKADGVLYEMVPPPRHLAFAITTRIKVMANLDIAERRLPQDGRIELTVGGHPVDLRVSVLPTMFGESVVMRVLDRSVVSLDLNKVGLDAQDAARLPRDDPQAQRHRAGDRADRLRQDDDAVLGAQRAERHRRQDHHHRRPGRVRHRRHHPVPIDPAIGITFAHCLRSILRQDPDKILVGEIRDLETAEIAVQASLTGHMVFSTLHTNDAPSTITRLRDMGVPPFLITATVEAILAQRLVRRICTQCREEFAAVVAKSWSTWSCRPATSRARSSIAARAATTATTPATRAASGLFELMVMNDDLRDMIIRNASTDELRETARSYGMVTLRDAGHGRGLRRHHDGRRSRPRNDSGSE